jgi:hypothetical protein
VTTDGNDIAMPRVHVKLLADVAVTVHGMLPKATSTSAALSEKPTPGRVRLMPPAALPAAGLTAGPRPLRATA